MEEKKDSVKKSNKLLNKGIFPFLFFILFGIVYFVYFMIFKDELLSNIPKDIILKATNGPLGIIFKNTFLIGLIGFVLGFLSMIITYILYILKIFGLRKVYILNPIFFAIAYGVWVVFGRRLIYREPRYTDYGIMIIDLVGKPSFYVGSGVLIFCILRFIISIIFYFTKKNK